MSALLQVRELRTYFGRPAHPVRAVDGVSFDIGEGETVALVGESGCGKSVTALSLARLVPEPPAFYAGGEVLYRGRDVLAMDDGALRALRGKEIAYIFQDPGASLNPVFRIGWQLSEAVRLHRKDADAKAETDRVLRQVGLGDPGRVCRAYPHELSGGMQQRVMIAMALVCRPTLLVADEPTTALDVTIQEQILELLAGLQAELGLSVLLITHNFGLVAEVAHRVHVMYAGKLVESGPTTQVLEHPSHPYTQALLQAVPRLDGVAGRLSGIDGSVPNAGHWPEGCRFHPRCPMARELCRIREPDFERVDEGRNARCHFWKETLERTSSARSSK